MDVLIALVFVTLAFLAFEIWRQIVRNARERRGIAQGRRALAYQKAWDMVFGRRRLRRLTHEKPDDGSHIG